VKRGPPNARFYGCRSTLRFHSGSNPEFNRRGSTQPRPRASGLRSRRRWEARRAEGGTCPSPPLAETRSRPALRAGRKPARIVAATLTSNDAVRKAGLEPARLVGATPSRWCVCQFRHFRKEQELGFSERGWNLPTEYVGILIPTSTLAALRLLTSVGMGEPPTSCERGWNRTTDPLLKRQMLYP
jgi:hypothetical protein